MIRTTNTMNQNLYTTPAKFTVRPDRRLPSRAPYRRFVDNTIKPLGRVVEVYPPELLAATRSNFIRKIGKAATP